MTETELIPQIGEKWILNRSSVGDPFPSKADVSVVILDVREGWVRYDMGGPFRDERKSIADFLSLYRRGV